MVFDHHSSVVATEEHKLNKYNRLLASTKLGGSMVVAMGRVVSPQGP